MPQHKEQLPYMVGGLLYTPALHTGIAERISDRTWLSLTSVALCLEDSIQAAALKKAEENV